VLEKLGIPVDVEPARAEESLRRHRFAFLFAPRYHAAMRHAMGARRALATRTVFNLLGPLTNPAGVKRQVIGVFSASLLEVVAEALQGLGAERAFVVHAADGIDEISLSAPTDIIEVRPAGIRRTRLMPEELGFARVAPERLVGADAAGNAAILEGVFAGEQGPARDVVLLNAAAALTAAGKADTFAEGTTLAAAAIDDGSVQALVAALREEGA
jgi:anthranilate phosphoribosyltransferase